LPKELGAATAGTLLAALLANAVAANGDLSAKGAHEWGEDDRPVNAFSCFLYNAIFYL
jgi:hypothetical protein